MRICRVTAVFVVFEKFGTVLHVVEHFFLFWKLNFQAVIKSALVQPPRRLGSCMGAPGRLGTVGRQGRPYDGSDRATARGAPLELPSLDLGFLEAALAAGLITA